MTPQAHTQSVLSSEDLAERARARLTPAEQGVAGIVARSLDRDFRWSALRRSAPESNVSS
jgi:hypothetical protein